MEFKRRKYRGQFRKRCWMYLRGSNKAFSFSSEFSSETTIVCWHGKIMGSFWDPTSSPLCATIPLFVQNCPHQWHRLNILVFSENLVNISFMLYSGMLVECILLQWISIITVRNSFSMYNLRFCVTFVLQI